MKVTILTVSFLREKNSDIHANLFIILKYPMSPRKLYDFKSKVTEGEGTNMLYRQQLNKVNVL